MKIHATKVELRITQRRNHTAGSAKLCQSSFRPAKGPPFIATEYVCEHYWAPQCALSQSQKFVGVMLTRALRFAWLKSYLRCSVAMSS